MNKYCYFLGALGLLWAATACSPKKRGSDIAIAFVPDTLQVGYTYWWPESGPFVGLCGQELSLVALGTLSALTPPSDDPGPLYTAKTGVLRLEQLFKIKPLGTHSYANQRFLRSDCFHKTGLEVGDTVLLCCYDYEGKYSLPGGKSLLKVSGPDDPAVAAIRRFIDAGEDPLSVQNDQALWRRYGLEAGLARLINCKKAAAEEETN